MSAGAVRQGEDNIVRIAVFASGAGSNFRRLRECGEIGLLGSGRVALLVSDKPTCAAVAYAHATGVPTVAVTHKEAGGKDAWERLMAAALQEHRVSLVVLAGYMRILGPTLIEAYAGRMINLHPSLLPQFEGLNAIDQALDAGVSETGVTVHYVDAGLDTGPVIAQERVPIYPSDTHDELAGRIHLAEHDLLPRVVRELCARERMETSL